MAFLIHIWSCSSVVMGSELTAIEFQTWWMKTKILSFLILLPITERKPSDFWLLNEGKKLLPVCSVSAPRVHTCQLGLTSAFPVPKKIAQILPIFLWVNFSSPGKNVANHLSSAMTSFLYSSNDNCTQWSNDGPNKHCV